MIAFCADIFEDRHGLFSLSEEHYKIGPTTSQSAGVICIRKKKPLPFDSVWKPPFPKTMRATRKVRAGCANGKRESNLIWLRRSSNHCANIGHGRRTSAIAGNLLPMKLKSSSHGTFPNPKDS